MKPKSKCVSKTKSKGENKIQSLNTSEYRDVPNRTSAKVTPEPAPLIQQSLKELAACFKAQGVLQPLLTWEKNPGKTTKRSWPEQNLCVLPHRSSSS